MSENKITIPFQIKGIRPCPNKKGYVEVMMFPVDKLEYDKDEKEEMPIKVMGTGPDGSPIPPEFQKQLSVMLKSAIPSSFIKKDDSDPRRFLHVESEIDFLARGWKYGDIIDITLKKVKEAEEVQPGNI
ncbi:MAG: hypothetical protein JSW06_03065 [Thermoplasmatales archaeon]|nr:MAG: hypothetical protein JSW06_03065 [Thermoplasmatales archaeon]